MGVMQLGDLRWRVDPNSVDWSFQMNTSVINTIGGQVVQIIGATLTDLVITGDFGQERASRNSPGGTVSWKLAAAFHTKIKALMDQQTQLAGSAKSSTSKSAIARARKTGVLAGSTAVHDPLPLTYHDGVHNWTFRVLIKSIDDGEGSGSFDISNGKFNYKYKLTLFIVESESTLVKKVASDIFLSRISAGLGWKQSEFNGPPKAQSAQDFIVANGGSVAAFLTKVLSGAPLTATSATEAQTDAATGQSDAAPTAPPVK